MKRKNKVLALLLALCMTLGILLVSPLSAFAEDTYTPGYYISSEANKIAVRSAPLSTSNQVGVLPRSTVVSVVEVVTMEKSWGRITYEGKSGWVRLDLCKTLNVNLYVVRLPEDAAVADTDFAAIRSDAARGDVDGVMICVGQVNRDAETPYVLNGNFADLAAAARKEGLAVGAYFVSDAVTAEEGTAQGAFVAAALDAANEELRLPVCVFYPSGSINAEENPAVGEAVAAYAEEIRAKGYYPGVYCDKALSDAAAKDAGKDTYAFWFRDIVSETLDDAAVTMWEYRVAYESEDYYASRYPMTLCLFDYPTLLGRGCAEGQHQPGNWIVQKEATCTEAGERVQRCTICRKILNTEVIEATGHTPVLTDPVSPTCTVDGQSTGTVCAVCKEVLYAPKAISATGHKWNEGEEKTDEAGQTITIFTCTACGMALQAESRFMTGDISMDGEVTAEDARLALRAAVGLSNYLRNGVEFAIADTNNDNGITAEDARSILRAAVGLDALGTVTYLLPDGKVTDRDMPEQPAEPAPEVTELTDDAAADLFAAANKIYLDWLSPVNSGPTYNKEETVDVNGKTYTLITDGEYKTVEELTSALAVYFLPEVYTTAVSENYSMVNEKFYGPASTAQVDGAAKIKLHVDETEDDTCTLKLALYAAKDDETLASEVTATLKWTDGAWKFASEFPYQIGFDAAYVK